MLSRNIIQVFVFKVFFVVFSVSVQAQEAPEFAAECAYAPDGPAALTVGVVDCLRIDSDMMGGKMPFSYFIPPACAPSTARKCPVFYWLHGLGGDYTVGLGSVGSTDSPWLAGLTSGPAVDVDASDEPWLYADPAGWEAKTPLDMIIVAPHGQTIAGGHGPNPDSPKSTGWEDFNPRYAEGGDEQIYDTPPPRNGSHVIKELIPYVEQFLPAIPGREGRSLAGISYGSIGTGIIGLTHPDLFSAMQMVSGVGVFWPNPCTPADPDFGQIGAPMPTGFIGSPGYQTIAETYLNPPVAFISTFGDAYGMDNVYARANHPPELLPNALAYNNGEQIVQLEISVNDSVPRSQDDAADPAAAINSAVAASLELALALTPAQVMVQDAQRLGVEHDYFLRPGIHSARYWNPHMRGWLEKAYAKMQHWDGEGHVYPRPDVFNYRTIQKEFDIWDWNFSLQRQPDEFINLTNASCDSITIRGSGVVTVTVPAHCGTQIDGARTATIELGPSLPVNEPSGSGNCQAWGHKVTIELEDIDGDDLTGGADNCPVNYNPGQEDADGNGVGDVCEDAAEDVVEEVVAPKDNKGGGAISWPVLLIMGIIIGWRRRLEH